MVGGFVLLGRGFRSQDGLWNHVRFMVGDPPPLGPLASQGGVSPEGGSGPEPDQVTLSQRILVNRI